MQASPRTAVLLTLLATFFWGSNFQATKIALTSLPPWTASVERFAVAAIAIMAILAFQRGIRAEPLRRNLLSFIVLGIVGVAGFNGALFVGLQTSSPITAALIMSTTPISANIIEAIFNRRAPDRLRIVGMIVSLAGVVLVITKGQIFSGHIPFAIGDLIILCGSLGWAFYTVGTRTHVHEATPLETTAWTMLFGTLALTAMALFFENPLAGIAMASVPSHLAGIYMGIAGSVLAYLFWNIGIATRGPGKTAAFFNFVPLFALLVQLATGFVPHPMQLIGAAVTILGVLIGQGKISFIKLGARPA
jgi:drug/metabolite transporter (DMT)-like permease